ncbi:hypothetical protein GGR44_003267 [Sphingobium fontiphilum]|uniref:Uncharacterized protein n=1 Tax=Sphingobium fontiphilum TaxID=944425 RepID=A0A7W6DLE6_9SPHN|nr:hypothetical protein [Sphingobium fontiphilum]MBB3983576.1 hypothetical protein [Sphingobium fontiphilum]
MKIFLSGMMLLLALAAPAQAEPLTTDAIIALANAGIGDEAIIAKIKSSDTKLELTTDQMIELKAKGISSAVMAALLEGNGRPATSTMSMDAADPMVPHPAGVYVLMNTASSARMQRIDPTMSNQAKTGGILGYAFTGGIASMSIKAAIQNETAKVRAISRRPVFYFFFDESNPDTARQMTSWAAGTAATVTSPAEFTLIKLLKKQGRREARVGSINVVGAKAGVMDKDRIPFEYEMVRQGVFRVIPSADLDDGEYGFIYAIAGGGTAGAMTARVFDFSI